MEAAVATRPELTSALTQAALYPRLRFMGSKYRLLPELLATFDELQPRRVLDAFSGSGVVSYALKANGAEVVSNDFLQFAANVAQAAVANHSERLSGDDVDLLCSPSADGRDFIQRTFEGLYFDQADHAFLDSAWSHLESFEGPRRSIAIAALCLAAARKQPRGVFTITTKRYDDGRRHMHMPLRDLFREAVADYNRAVFDSGAPCAVLRGDVFDLDPSGYDVVYLDPPYAPPRDDNCYIKRYHFLEGLAVYWRGQEILYETKTLKLKKKYTPFSYKKTIRDALSRTFDQFAESRIVLSYGSNSVPEIGEIVELLEVRGREVKVREVSHRYSFGTHKAATRRVAKEYIVLAR